MQRRPYRVRYTWGNCTDWVTYGTYANRVTAVRAMHRLRKVLSNTCDNHIVEILEGATNV